MNHFLLIILLLFNFINTQTCGIKNPEGFEDCDQDSNDESVCCYSEVSFLDQPNTLCIFIPRSQIFLTPYITAMDIGFKKNLIKMNIDCNATNTYNDSRPYTPCGQPNPEKPEDCFEYSLSNSSCCYIKSPDGKSYCLWDDGNSKHNSEYFGTEVACSSFFIKLGECLLLLFLLL